MAKVVFVDGSLVTANSWYELEVTLRQDPWNPSKKPKFRAEMARRAWNWSQTDISDDVEQASYRFFQSLELAGMLRIVKEEESK